MIDIIARIRAGTEQQNEYVCDHCGEELRAGGVKICFDNFTSSLFICSNCIKIGKISQSRRKS